MGNDDKRRKKRFDREHRGNNGVRLVYRCKTDDERRRRVARAEQLVGTPFISLPGVIDRKATIHIAEDGTPIPAETVEMVFNDALLMDAVSNWGEDGPLYRDTLDTSLHREVYELALKKYAGVEIPQQLRNPNSV